VVPIDDGRQRVVIEAVAPTVDAGRFPVKRELGDRLVVEADVFADGHDSLSGEVVAHPPAGEPRTYPLEFVDNDRWRAVVPLDAIGRWQFSVHGWIDHFESWRKATLAKVRAGQDVSVELVTGKSLIDAALAAAGPDEGALASYSGALSAASGPALAQLLENDEGRRLMARYGERHHVTQSRAFPLVVDPVRARFSAWYELFPRSASPDPNRPGTFDDVIARLPYVAGLGFDVLYLPPISPIGRAHRKGPNNSVTARPGDPGSPWAIGGPEGGHDAINPELGTEADFRRLVTAADDFGIAVALDIAFQCSPDHPWVKEHPSWFRWRPDGTVQYAENPPKKYQDIYPIDFESEDWRGLWAALEGVFRHWIDTGVRIFRVDNPHTKSFAFWEQCITNLKADFPDVLFLAEAFTRPKVMHRLAKLGFSQSYTYFTWRNSSYELQEYFTELSQDPSRDYFRPNVWPNTPDILHEYLQQGARPAFVNRLVLAATLAANYGVYGPAFELWEHEPREPGSEEYRDSEKYQQRLWDLDRPDSLRLLMARVNHIRRENPALQHDWSLRFHAADNPMLLCYSKMTPDRSNVILTVASTDWRWPQSGFVDLDLGALGVADGEPYVVEDLLYGGTYTWQGARNFVSLMPGGTAAHILRVERRGR